VIDCQLSRQQQQQQQQQRESEPDIPHVSWTAVLGGAPAGRFSPFGGAVWFLTKVVVVAAGPICSENNAKEGKSTTRGGCLCVAQSGMKEKANGPSNE
jgi:hypothetical protein